MALDIARREQTFRPLSVHEAGPSRQHRLPFLATISSGTKNSQGTPSWNKDFTISVHDEGVGVGGRGVTGLRAALAANKNICLTVAFPSDRIEDFIIQRFERWTRTRLEAHGDEHEITVIQKIAGQNPSIPDKDAAYEHIVYTRAEHPVEYRREVSTCKLASGVLFYLAEWDKSGEGRFSSTVVFPDGMLPYRLRTGSTRSLHQFVESIEGLRRLTGGPIAGIPFLVYFERLIVVDGTSHKREVPVWKANFRPPSELRLTADAFRSIAEGGVSQMRTMRLVEPAAEPEMIALPEPSAETLNRFVERGGVCDADRWLGRIWSTARGSFLEDQTKRAEWVALYTDGNFTSLSDYLREATEDEAEALYTAIQETLGMIKPVQETARERTERVMGEIEHNRLAYEALPADERAAVRAAANRTYDQIFPDEDDEPPARQTLKQPAAPSASQVGPSAQPSAPPSEGQALKQPAPAIVEEEMPFVWDEEDEGEPSDELPDELARDKPTMPAIPERYRSVSEALDTYRALSDYARTLDQLHRPESFTANPTVKDISAAITRLNDEIQAILFAMADNTEQ